MYKSILISLLSMVIVLHAPAQISGIKIEGRIINEKEEAIEFATVLLRQPQDSSLIMGTTTNASGAYILSSVKPGTYRVTGQFVGYISESFTIEVRDSDDIRLPDIVLKEDTKLLKEVVVLGQKPLIEQEGEKLILNVQNTIIATGGSVIELLTRAPGVSIDQNDQISLNGKAGVALMIDGKLTYLPATELAAMLRSMNANNVASVEIISNPTSRYDAAGNSGIINIKLKKNTWEGFNGAATAGTGYGTYGKANASFNLNYHTGKWNHFVNYGYTFNRRFAVVEINRNSIRNGQPVYFQQYSDRLQELSASTWQAGTEWQWNAKNSLAITTSGSYNERMTDSQTFTGIYSSLENDPDSTLTMSSDQGYRWHTVTGTLGYKHLFTKQGHELTVDMDYSNHGFALNDDILVSEFDRDNSVKNKYSVLTHQPSSFTIYAARADYTQPLNKQSSLEVGVKYSNVTTTSNVVYANNQSGYYQPDLVRSSDFKYIEQISAAYGSLKTVLAGFRTQVGIRGEQTHYEGYSEKTSSSIERNYFRFFPNLNISRDLTKNYRLGFSYSHRIDRPAYNDLYPFVYFLDPFTGQQGNPLLLPQLTHSLQLSQTIAKDFTLNIGYSTVSRYMAYVIVLNEDNVSGYSTRENLDNYSNYYINAIAPIHINKRWTVNANVNIYYNRFNTQLFTDTYTIARLSGAANISQTILLPWGMTGEITATYQAPNAVGIFQNRAMGSLNAGLLKQLFDKKLSLRVNITDIFETNRLRNRVSYTGFDMNMLNQVETRMVRLNITYNFGKNTSKSSRKRNAQEEELRRINTN
jgi:hypothetical protein